ncbi:MAG: hypothetical protein Q4F65_08800 [Propionibacteriaceae bacterium]|nr:hypothetical protein [Propionibacteriaceae bacterium]
MADIRLVDQTLRDGQQSLWGLRMLPSEMLPVAERLDGMPFHAVDVGAWPGLILMAKRKQIDPWSMLDALSAAMPNQTLRAVSRSNGIGDFKATPQKVLHASVNAFIQHRVTSFWILDVLYDLPAMKRLVEYVARQGGRPVPSIMFGETPFHTDQFFADAAREMASWTGVEEIYVEDASGVLTPERAHTLIPAIVEGAGGKAVELHCHNNLGLGAQNYVIGADAGVTVLHTSIGALADGYSLPDMRQTIRNLRRAGHAIEAPTPALAEIESHLAATAVQNGYDPAGGVPRYDARAFDHQLPGGMTSTLLHQLREYRAEHRFDELIDEIAQVRIDMGYPVMATPVSQIVGGQALSNILTGKRYTVLLDSVIEYVQGGQGRPLGPIAPDLVTRVEETVASRTVPTPQPVEGSEDQDVVLRYFLTEKERAALRPDPRPATLRRHSTEPSLTDSIRQVAAHADVTHLSVTTRDGHSLSAAR